MTRHCLFAGVLGLLAFSAPALADAPAGRYTFPASGTVYDTRTKLTWQRVADGNEYTQSAAASYCASLSLAGTGWRLPSADELLTLIDPTRYNPAVDPAFSSSSGNPFWSSTPYAGSSDRGWTVYFLEGSSSFYLTSSKCLVRCVR